MRQKLLRASGTGTICVCMLEKQMPTWKCGADLVAINLNPQATTWKTSAQ